MKFLEAPKSVILDNFFNFRSRASRSEFWWWILFCFLLGFVIGFIQGFYYGLTGAMPPKIDPVSLTMQLLLFIPSLSVNVRRLHDIDKSGWWILISFTIIGIIPLLYWYCKKGDDAINSYGPPPLS